jgi:AraC-like DNA-binding protein
MSNSITTHPSNRSPKYLYQLTPENPLTAEHKVFKKPVQGYYQIHPFWELGVVIRGRYLAETREGVARINPGGIWWHGPWEPHNYSMPEPNTEIVVVEFLAPVVYALPDNRPVLYFPFLQPETREKLQKRTPRSQVVIKEMVLGLAQEYADQLPDWQTAIQARLWLLLAEIVREHQFPVAAIKNQPESGGRILAAIDYVSKNLGGKITLEEAARQARLSRTQFIRFFKKNTGFPFYQYVTKCRLEGVRHELYSDTLKLDALARQWGFHDASHLLKQYRKYFGCTPSQDRKKLAGRGMRVLPGMVFSKTRYLPH